MFLLFLRIYDVIKIIMMTCFLLITYLKITCFYYFCGFVIIMMTYFLLITYLKITCFYYFCGFVIIMMTYFLLIVYMKMSYLCIFYYIIFIDIAIEIIGITPPFNKIFIFVFPNNFFYDIYFRSIFSFL